MASAGSSLASSRRDLACAGNAHLAGCPKDLLFFTPLLGSPRLIGAVPGDLKGRYFATVMWDETNAQKDGTIDRETQFPKDDGQWILSGPHFFVGTPFYTQK
jgi:hypothetical protein